MLDDAVFILHFERGMNPNILFPSMRKKQGRLDFLTLRWQPTEKEVKPVKFRLRIDLVSHTAYEGGVG